MKKLRITLLLLVAINPLVFGQVQSNLELFSILKMSRTPRFLLMAQKSSTYGTLRM